MEVDTVSEDSSTSFVLVHPPAMVLPATLPATEARAARTEPNIEELQVWAKQAEVSEKDEGESQGQGTAQVDVTEVDDCVAERLKLLLREKRKTSGVVGAGVWRVRSLPTISSLPSMAALATLATAILVVALCTEVGLEGWEAVLASLSMWAAADGKELLRLYDAMELSGLPTLPGLPTILPPFPTLPTVPDLSLHPSYTLPLTLASLAALCAVRAATSTRARLAVACCLAVAATVHLHLAARAEEARVVGGRAMMRREFTEWLGRPAEGPAGGAAEGVDLQFRGLQEFHRCKALEDVNLEAFDAIVENMARVLQVSDDRREEIKLAKHAQTMVNVLEDFEHGRNGSYTYGKYQTLRRAGGNIDIVFAVHSFRWELAEELPELESIFSSSVSAAARRPARTVTMAERAAWKAAFRAEAMRLFETDCPQQLVTELRLQERREKAARREEEVRARVRLLYQHQRWEEQKEQIKRSQSTKGDKEDDYMEDDYMDNDYMEDDYI